LQDQGFSGFSLKRFKRFEFSRENSKRLNRFRLNPLNPWSCKRQGLDRLSRLLARIRAFPGKRVVRVFRRLVRPLTVCDEIFDHILELLLRISAVRRNLFPEKVWRRLSGVGGWVALFPD